MKQPFRIAKGDIKDIPSQTEADKVYVGISSVEGEESKIIIDGKEWMSKEYVDKLKDEVILNEEVTAASLNDLKTTKQEALISGETIKTVNGEDILGQGNIEIRMTAPTGGWQKTDLSDEAQASLERADNALVKNDTVYDADDVPIRFDGDVTIVSEHREPLSFEEGYFNNDFGFDYAHESDGWYFSVNKPVIAPNFIIERMGETIDIAYELTKIKFIDNVLSQILGDE